MSSEIITATALRVPTITAVVGTRIALARLPEGAGYPAIVHHTITDAIAYAVECGRVQVRTARVQIDALGHTIAAAKELAQLAAEAMTMAVGGSVAGFTVLHSRPLSSGITEHYASLDVWRVAADYRIVYH